MGQKLSILPQRRVDSGFKDETLVPRLTAADSRTIAHDSVGGA